MADREKQKAVWAVLAEKVSLGLKRRTKPPAL